MIIVSWVIFNYFNLEQLKLKFLAFLYIVPLIQGIKISMKKITIKGLESLQDFAKGFLSNLKSDQSLDRAVVVALSGDLGVGKTTFVQSLAKELGVEDIVTSPTYTILKQYETGEGSKFECLIHMDAYRLDSVDELEPLRFDEFLNKPNTLLCIEWAEKIKEVLPKDTIFISLNIIDENTREIVVS
jgi:tRNA threonylcarbamoyladenosine biosynthesis protein TsaE